ncbi:MAG: LysR family transcriptional regulator [Pseudomonadota bacterium]
MNWQAVSFDWNQVRAFLATVEEGSLSAAARALGMTQPTLSRQVSALEADLGVTLFERGPRATRLTEAGARLLDHVRAMGEAANRVSLAASGQSQTIEGRVSITATHTFATYHLPRVLKRLRDIAPGIAVEIVASNDVRDLARREADIAIRHARPEQGELIAKLISETTAHLYAAPAYLDRMGRPASVEDLANHDVIGFDTIEQSVEMFQFVGAPVAEHNIKIATGSGTALLELLRLGLGITIMTRDTADLVPALERVLPSFQPIPVPIWLVTHRELHTSRRIRVVFDLLAEELAELPHPALPAIGPAG